MRQPVLGTAKHQLTSLFYSTLLYRDKIKTVFIYKPTTRLKRIDVTIDNSWNEYIQTGGLI